MTGDHFQAYLDDISECFVRRDYGQWRHRVVMPFTLISQTGTDTLRSEADLQRQFDQNVVACQMQALDCIYRLPVSLEDCRDGCWLGTYETHLISRNQRIVDPYAATAMLVVRHGRFVATSILGARGLRASLEAGSRNPAAIP